MVVQVGWYVFVRIILLTLAFGLLFALVVQVLGQNPPEAIIAIAGAATPEEASLLEEFLSIARAYKQPESLQSQFVYAD